MARTQAEMRSIRASTIRICEVADRLRDRNADNPVGTRDVLAVADNYHLSSDEVRRVVSLINRRPADPFARFAPPAGGAA